MINNGVTRQLLGNVRPHACPFKQRVTTATLFEHLQMSLKKTHFGSELLRMPSVLYTIVLQNRVQIKVLTTAGTNIIKTKKEKRKRTQYFTAEQK